MKPGAAEMRNDLPKGLLPKRTLGRTTLALSELGFGGAPLGNLYQPLDDDTARATLSAAWQGGIRHFDTAPLYGHGLSEHRTGQFLRDLPREDFVLSTKVGRLLRASPHVPADAGLYRSPLPFSADYDYSYDGIIRSVEDSLQRLGLARIDILYIHDVDTVNHGPDGVQVRFREAMEGYRALERLRDQRLVGAIGAGINEWQMCENFARAGDFDCFLLAGRYTLLEQEALDSFLPLCEDRGIGIILGGPYNTGILVTGAKAGAWYNYGPASQEILARVTRIEMVCQSHNVTLAAAALQFPLLHPAVASVIPGCRQPVEVEQNLALYRQPISEGLWRDLKTEGLIRDDAPVDSGCIS